MARKTPEEILTYYCEYGRADAETALNSLSRNGYVVVTKAELQALRRAAEQLQKLTGRVPKPAGRHAEPPVKAARRRRPAAA